MPKKDKNDDEYKENNTIGVIEDCAVLRFVKKFEIQTKIGVIDKKRDSFLRLKKPLLTYVFDVGQEIVVNHRILNKKMLKDHDFVYCRMGPYETIRSRHWGHSPRCETICIPVEFLEFVSFSRREGVVNGLLDK